MPESLQIQLVNNSDSDNINAYITGIAIQHGGQRCILKANGKDLYFPTDPPKIGSPLTEDCAISLGKPGNVVNVNIPQIAGGRIWLSTGPLTFLLNPGPALVEPSVLNPSDLNAQVDFGFCEFTLNSDQLYANLSYVDFTPRLPIAIALEQQSGQKQEVLGMAPDGIDKLAEGLRAQSQKDGKPWDKLIIPDSQGRPLRVLNATHADAVGASFAGYYEPYVEEVWKYYSTKTFTLDTQAGPGVLTGSVKGADMTIGDESFCKPSTLDILGCNSGPFTTGSNPTRNAIIPRLAAAFHRTALLETNVHPSHHETFYMRDPTNHYGRVLHEINLDHKGYAFAYDDVQPEDGTDQSGKVNAGDPKVFIVTVGGKGGASIKGVCETAPELPSIAPVANGDAQEPLQQNGDKPCSPSSPERKGWRGKLKGLLSK
ncbi:glycoside hydrolase family 64 protein [Piedraia hortae CBS 480.64]|uniref:Glycoside hydrolase family 64 protein n=1 Tax=Piedraia hortae CBS 480.64 TaxID=1314780 RepID=A0A6A7C7Q7_9PEZI|nr:glycoside hydrolase family 64 protein [Piedraia hortae CBS 480.64]